MGYGNRVSIRGITLQIDGNVQPLSNALKSVNGQIRETKTELSQIEKLLRLDPGNVELLKQKQEALTKAIDATKKKLDEEKLALEQLKNGEQTEKTRQQQEALTREIIETEQALKNLEKEYSDFGSVSAQKIAAVGEKVQGMGQSMENAGKSLLPVTAAITALGTAAIAMTSEFDAAMSKVAAISGATGKDFDALREKAREMGEKTKYSATEAAEAMTYMAMAGWKTGDMLSGIEGIITVVDKFIEFYFKCGLVLRERVQH